MMSCLSRSSHFCFRDGVGLSGVYIIAKTEIDRLENEGAVDVFQSLQRLRKNCPFAIQAEVGHLDLITYHHKNPVSLYLNISVRNVVRLLIHFNTMTLFTVQ